MRCITSSSLVLGAVLALSVQQSDAHSWAQSIAGGIQRGGLGGTDLDRQRYFCPTSDLSQCQPAANTNIVLTAENQRPCRSGESSTWGSASVGGTLDITWPSNGHANSQSDGTCVQVMIAPYSADPDYSSFSTIAACLSYPATQATVSLPSSVKAGKYTVFWLWEFATFYYSSCVDINVGGGSGGSDPTSAPTSAPKTDAPATTSAPTSDSSATPGTTSAPLLSSTTPAPDASSAPVDEPTSAPEASTTVAPSTNTRGGSTKAYLRHGCENLADPLVYCRRKFGFQSHCDNHNPDACGRAICSGDSYESLKKCKN